VVDELDKQGAQLAFVPNERGVEQFVTNSPDPSLRVAVRRRRPRGSGDGRCADGREDVVEDARVLPGAIVDQEPHLGVEAHEEVRGLLGSPWSGRIGGDPGEVDPS